MTTPINNPSFSDKQYSSHHLPNHMLSDNTSDLENLLTNANQFDDPDLSLFKIINLDDHNITIQKYNTDQLVKIDDFKSKIIGFSTPEREKLVDNEDFHESNWGFKSEFTAYESLSDKSVTLIDTDDATFDFDLDDFILGESEVGNMNLDLSFYEILNLNNDDITIQKCDVNVPSDVDKMKNNSNVFIARFPKIALDAEKNDQINDKSKPQLIVPKNLQEQFQGKNITVVDKDDNIIASYEAGEVVINVVSAARINLIALSIFSRIGQMSQKINDQLKHALAEDEEKQKQRDRQEIYLNEANMKRFNRNHEAQELLDINKSLDASRVVVNGVEASPLRLLFNAVHAKKIEEKEELEEKREIRDLKDRIVSTEIEKTTVKKEEVARSILKNLTLGL